jgi:hypothetical protein
MSHSQLEIYTFKRLSREGLADVQKLYLLAFGIEVSLNSLEAKYQTGQFGADFIGYLVYSHEGDVAAYYGVFPLVMELDGKAVLVGQSGDTMTAPSHRMRGLFVEAARRTYELAASEGLQFIFGFPNKNSYPGFKTKLGWKFFGNLNDIRLNCKGVPLAAISKRFKTFRRPVEVLIRNRLNRIQFTDFEGTKSVFSGFLANHVPRSLEFIEYKLLGGAYLVQWKGFSLFVKIDGELIIGDCSYFESDKLSTFLKAIQSLGRYLFCHRILISLTSNHWLFGYFLKANVDIQQGLPIGFFPLVKVDYPFSSISFSRLDADTF